MMAWRFMLEPKHEKFSLCEAADLAERVGYKMLVYEGKVYEVTPRPADNPKLWPVESEEKPELDPEMFVQPDVFCVMDPSEQGIAQNEYGIMLFSNPIAAHAVAEKAGGKVQPYWRALYLQRKNASVIAPVERPRLIVPGR